MQEFDQPSVDAPALALVMNAVEMAAHGQALSQRGGTRQFGLLLDERDAETLASLDLAVIQVDESGDNLQQRRFTSAIAAN